LRYIRIGRRKRGHGHIAVYRVDEDAVRVLHIFHTAQDWQTKLAAENPSQ
jgi:plasmid stabilization system protein ParE